MMPRVDESTREGKLTMPFAKIQEHMQTFETTVVPRFSTLTEMEQRGATNMEEQALLSGSITQGLHERFVALQQKLPQFESMDETTFGNFLAEVKIMERDLGAHIPVMQRLMDKVKGEVSGGMLGGAGGGVAMGERLSVSTPGTGNQHMRGDPSQNRNDLNNMPKLDLNAPPSGATMPPMGGAAGAGTPSGFGGGNNSHIGRTGTPAGFGGAGAKAGHNGPMQAAQR